VVNIIRICAFDGIVHHSGGPAVSCILSRLIHSRMASRDTSEDLCWLRLFIVFNPLAIISLELFIDIVKDLFRLYYTLLLLYLVTLDVREPNSKFPQP